MINEPDPNAIAARLLQRAHNRDGLPEAAVGLFFLMVAALQYATIVLPRGTHGYVAAVLALSFGIPVGCIGAKPFVEWVRRRWLLQREGYVRYRPVGWRPIAVGVLLALLMAAALLAVSGLSHPDRWLLAGTGVFGGALAAFCGRQMRFIVGGVLMAVAGLAIAFVDVSLPLGFALLFGFNAAGIFL